MQNIRSSGTLPEKIVIRELRRRGYYFATNVDTIPGKPDIVFRRKKVAVFIDSDFWHRNKRVFQMPQTNVAYWKTKIAKNVARDAKVSRLLKTNGWIVLRLWESDVKKKPERCIEKIIAKIDGD